MSNNRNNLVGQLIWYVHPMPEPDIFKCSTHHLTHSTHVSKKYCKLEVCCICTGRSQIKNFILLIQSRSPVLSIHTHWVIPNPNMVKSHTCIKCVDVHRLKSQSLMSNRREKNPSWPSKPNDPSSPTWLNLASRPSYPPPSTTIQMCVWIPFLSVKFIAFEPSRSFNSGVNVRLFQHQVSISFVEAQWVQEKDLIRDNSNSNHRQE